MDKRYQVFVSSTYADLREERQSVIQALMEMDCIPSGMELFPAADEEQFEFIKRVIDDCDYYLLIIGGHYGSTTSEGISYTEKEYDYAIEKGIKVVALLHANPDEISVAKSEKDPKLRARLENFRQKVSTDRLVKFWNSSTELPGLVALSLSKTIKMYPSIGWVRANYSSNVETLNELNELRKEKDTLQATLREISGSSEELPDLADLDELIGIPVTFTNFDPGDEYSNGRDVDKEHPLNLSWGEIFGSLAPRLLKEDRDIYVKVALQNIIAKKTQNESASLDEESYQTIQIQLQALKLIELRYTSGGILWKLTDLGHSTMMALRTVKTKKSNVN